MKDISTKDGTIILLAIAYVAMAVIAYYALATINMLSNLI